MGGDMVGLAAFDFILRRSGARAVRVTLVIEVTGVNLNDASADVSGLGVPSDPVADLELFSHLHSPNGRCLPDISKLTIRPHL